MKNLKPAAIALAAALFLAPPLMPVQAAQGQAEKPSVTADSIAALGDLAGYWTFPCTYNDTRVDISSEANPYDLDWSYGPAPDEGLGDAETKEFINDESWGSLWESYVDYCDWSLVFDAKYYMEKFPLLADLYGHDEDALLRHYQTLGVHEGRQANEAFCPAAYMANCSGDLKNKFGDSPECYVIYYMAHYKAESKVDTANGDKGYPVWLDVEMSYAQSRELDMINQYRAEAGVDPVEPHPEIMAAANVRCRIDAIGQYKAHDWLHTEDHKEKHYIKTLRVKWWDENTIKKTTATGEVCARPYYSYYKSQPHYEAMVDPVQEYAGTSNFYYSPGWKKIVHFQIFVPNCPKPGTNKMP